MCLFFPFLVCSGNAVPPPMATAPSSTPAAPLQGSTVPSVDLEEDDVVASAPDPPTDDPQVEGRQAQLTA